MPLKRAEADNNCWRFHPGVKQRWSRLRLCSADSRQTGLECEKNGAPDRIRTCDLWNRNPTLYPAELRVLARREPPSDEGLLACSLRFFNGYLAGPGLPVQFQASAPAIR